MNVFKLFYRVPEHPNVEYAAGIHNEKIDYSHYSKLRDSWFGEWLDEKGIDCKTLTEEECGKQILNFYNDTIDPANPDPRRIFVSVEVAETKPKTGRVMFHQHEAEIKYTPGKNWASKKFKLELSDKRPLSGAEYNAGIYTCPDCGSHVTEIDAENNSPNIIGFNYHYDDVVVIMQCPYCFCKYFHHIDVASYDSYKRIKKHHKEIK